MQPANKSDGWNTDPFVLTEVEASAKDDKERGYGQFPSGGKLYGRGTTDDKGPALSWLFVVEAYQKLKIDLPVNLLFLVSASVKLISCIRLLVALHCIVSHRI